MINEIKEVYFEQYCHKCIHKNCDEDKEPCHDCLNTFYRENSHKPEKFEEDEKYENSRDSV